MAELYWAHNSLFHKLYEMSFITTVPVLAILLRFTWMKPPPARLSIKSLIDEGIITLDIRKLKNPTKDGINYHVIYSGPEHITKQLAWKPNNQGVLCYASDYASPTKITKEMLPECVRKREGLD